MRRRIADGLVRKGLIERSLSESDRRFQGICLAEKGAETLNQTRTYLADGHVPLMAFFDHAKRTALANDFNLSKEKMEIVQREL